jgi:hypothetical protein
MSAWKLYMPATLTSRVELLLFDPLTKRAKHGERARITTQLWEEYLERVRGIAEGERQVISLPRLEDVIYEFEGHRFSYSELLAILKEHHDRSAASSSG